MDKNLIKLALGLQLFAIGGLHAISWNSAWKSVKKQAAKLAQDPAVQQAVGAAAVKGLGVVAQKVDAKNEDNGLVLGAAAGLVNMVQAATAAKFEIDVESINAGLREEAARAAQNLENALDPNADQQVVAQETEEILAVSAEVLDDELVLSSEDLMGAFGSGEYEGELSPTKNSISGPVTEEQLATGDINWDDYY